MLRRNLMAFLAVVMLFWVTGCGEKITKIEIRHRYSRGRIDNLSPQESALEQVLQEAVKLDSAVKYAKGIFDVAYIVAVEHPNLGFTIYFKDNQVIVERGLDISKEPTLVIPLSDDAIFNTKKFFEDGVVSEEEEFLIVNGIFKPAWDASYRIPEMQSKWIRKFMRLEGLMHVVLLNKNNFEYQGKVVKNELSVVRANNQWLVFNGIEGVPNSRMELTAKDAVAMYKLIMRDLRDAKSLSGKMQIMNKFEAIRNRCLVKK